MNRVKNKNSMRHHLLRTGCLLTLLGMVPSPVFSGSLPIEPSHLSGRVFPSMAQSSLAGVESRQAMEPVRMILSAHGSLQDADWIVQQLSAALTHASNKPIVIWMEHATPSGLPQDVAVLQKLFPSIEGTEINWFDELSRETLNDKPREYLKRLFDAALKLEGDPRESFLKTSDPFTAKLREGIQRLKGVQISFEIENPSFEAYVNDLRGDAMGRITMHWLERKENTKAFLSLVSAYQFFSESIKIRDRQIASQMALYAKKHEGSRQIVIRGLAHEFSMKKSLLNRGIQARAVVQKSASSGRHGIRAYLMKYHELPSLESRAGIVFLAHKLLELNRQ